MGTHASKTPERASLGKASLQPCSLDSRMLSSATCLCWPSEPLRKLTSQHPHEQGPKSILELGCHLARKEVPTCPQGGTSNNQFGDSSPLPLPSSFAPSVFGKPRTTQMLISHPCNLPSPSPPWETCLPQSLALSPAGAWPLPYRLQPGQPGQGVAEPPSFYRDTRKEKSLQITQPGVGAPVASLSAQTN